MPAPIGTKLDAIRAATEELNAAVAGLDRPGGDGTLSRAESQKIVGAAQKVLEAAKEPADLGIEMFGHITLMVACRVFWDWGVFDEIPREGSVSYEELAAKAGAELSVLTRIGAVLVTTGMLEQIGPDKVAHTARSLIFTGDDPAGFTFHMGWENGLSSYSTLPQYFQKYGRKEPETENHVPVTFANGTPALSFYEMLRHDPARRIRFMKAMGPLEKSMPITGIYDFRWVVDWSQAHPNSDRLVLVDVGGGKAQAIKAIHKENPDLPLKHCLLQDLPEVIETVKSLDDPDIQQIQKMAIDFHREQPVKGALVYWIRKCLHNYSDVICVKILKNLAEALADDSKILIQEDILTNPPNTMAAMSDMIMLSFGGKQRTIECWQHVIADAGLKISGVFRGKATFHSISVLECVKNTP